MIVDRTGTLNSIFYFHSITAGIFLTLLTIVSKPWKEWHLPKNADKSKREDVYAKPQIKKTNVLDDPDVTAEELRENGSSTSIDMTRAVGSRRTSIVDAARRASRRASIAASLGITAMTSETSVADESGPSVNWLLAPDVIVFFFSNTVLGGVFSVLGSFLWIYLTNELDANATVRGLTGTAQVILQLPFFFFAKQVNSLYPFLLCVLSVLKCSATGPRSPRNPLEYHHCTHCDHSPLRCISLHQTGTYGLFGAGYRDAAWYGAESRLRVADSQKLICRR